MSYIYLTVNQFKNLTLDQYINLDFDISPHINDDIFYDSMIYDQFQSLTIEQYLNMGLVLGFDIPQGISRGVKVAQLFDVDGFIPSKASIYLKRVGKNISDSFNLTGGYASIDAANFKKITKSERRLFLSNHLDGYTGAGTMSIDENNSSSDFPIIYFPITTFSPKGYNVYARIHSEEDLELSVFLNSDNVLTYSDSFSGGWKWHNLGKIIIGDRDVHDLGIQMKSENCHLDKIYISSSSFALFDQGPGFSDSPYLTTHMQLFDVVENTPSSPFFVYDYKTTLEDIDSNGWYNYNISPMANEIEYSEKCAISICASGGSFKNFILWEVDSNNEDSSQYSAIRI